MRIKHYITGTILFAAIASASCKNNTAKHKKQQDPNLVMKDTAAYTQVQFVDSAQSFGTVTKGEQVKLKYTVRNTGDYPLYISNVQPSCGCTVADYTKEPILPGKDGYINATFDSNHGAAGTVHKSIIVTTNTKNNPNFVLSFEGNIVDKK
ncbi:MAG: DUF1573 domain-containing protein [Chitinophagaceae bacterium]